ncbi:MAG: DUF2442 domain-containing protein [Clostridia bacterium]|nr:DUF2442 domain-containing protein [Clostridia bacterium]
MEKLIIGQRALSPDAASVTPLDDHILRVRFVNGELRDFDMKPLLPRKCYSALASEALFRTARVEYGVVIWANGADLDPEWLYTDSVPAR